MQTTKTLRRPKQASVLPVTPCNHQPKTIRLVWWPEQRSVSTMWSHGQPSNERLLGGASYRAGTSARLMLGTVSRVCLGLDAFGKWGQIHDRPSKFVNREKAGEMQQGCNQLRGMTHPGSQGRREAWSSCGLCSALALVLRRHD